MKTRAITGFFFVIVMLASVLLGSYVFSGFFFVLSLFCLQEFYKLIKESGTANLNMGIGLATGIFVFVFFALGYYLDGRASGRLLILLPVILSSIFILELYRKSDRPFNNIAYTITGLVFVIVPFTFFHSLGFVQSEYNFHFPLAFLLMLWANDTGAYLSGRAFGRTKLFERHSPKKTWEGFIGGVLISAVVGFILSLYYPELEWKQWVSVAILISCFGTLGDLVESMLKRSINIKDSGGILPGHGGLLDRFDGLFVAAPVVYAYIYLITKL